MAKKTTRGQGCSGPAGIVCRLGTGRPAQAQPHEAFALGYVVTRTVEVVLLLPAAVGPLLLLAVSPPQSTAALAEPTQFRTLRTLLLSYVWRCGI